MNRHDVMCKSDDLANVVGFPITAVLLVLAWLLAPGIAQACCSCSGVGCQLKSGFICCGGYCVSHSSDCVCGAQTPVCNAFGCNCNSQCGSWPCTLTSKVGACSFNPTCPDDANAQREAKARFDAIDSNHDGKISLDETRAWTKSLKQPLAKMAHGLPKHLSAPKASEEKILRFLFDQMDTNKDGIIQPGELDKSLAAPAKAGA